MHKILLVEDDTTLRDAYQMILSRPPFDLSVAEDGVQALKLCAKNKYELILLDLMMPNLDGIGFLKAAKLHETAPKTKVIIFSNLSSGDEVDTVKSMGIYKILLKAEVDPSSLIKELKAALKVKV